MRKFFPLVLVLLVVMVSSFAFADSLVDLTNYGEHVGDNGIIIVTDIDRSQTPGKENKYVVLQELNRTSYYFDNNAGDARNVTQGAEVTIKTEAYIPCYLTMTVLGNQGKTVIESFGPGAHGAEAPTGYILAFDNEIGGFVNEDWASLGHGKNAELAPGAEIYIQGCDLFKVDVYANDSFKYEVWGKALKSSNADTTVASKLLPLEMRSKIDAGNWGAKRIFAAEAAEVEPIAQRAATQSLSVYHQFRVPYTTSTAHGKYTGNVVFKAYTI